MPSVIKKKKKYLCSITCIPIVKEESLNYKFCNSSPKCLIRNIYFWLWGYVQNREKWNPKLFSELYIYILNWCIFNVLY